LPELPAPNKGGRYKFPVYPSGYCFDCSDKGFINQEIRFLINLDEAKLIQTVIDGIIRRMPCACKLGEKTLMAWQAINGCECFYGENLDGTFCLKCEEGQMLSEKVRALIQAKKQALLDKLVAASGLTELMKEQTFDSFSIQNEPELESAKSMVMDAARNYRSVVLIGNTGTGKSHLAAAYLNYAITQGRTGVFVSLIDLMASLRMSVSSNEPGQDWDSLLNRFIGADILVLDDLGQEKATDKVIEVLFFLLNSRVNRQKTTVVTSNYRLKELRDTYGYSAAIVSRLAGFQRISWDCEDYRI
jgi:DNA replication protein DnaC